MSPFSSERILWTDLSPSCISVGPSALPATVRGDPVCSAAGTRGEALSPVSGRGTTRSDAGERWADRPRDIPTWQDGEFAHALVAARLGVDDRLPACTPWDWRGARRSRHDGRPDDPGPAHGQDTPEELSALHGAGEAVDRVHARIGEWLRPGRTEDEIGSDIAAALAEEGHERADFVIVASGPHGASPHHGRSDRVVRAGEPVVVDIGGPAPSGHFSDSTLCNRSGQDWRLPA